MTRARKVASSRRPAGKTPPTYLVGIGASAGGLEALRALFSAMKAAPRSMAFVVVQHLAPLHRSRLVELIASTTKLSVEEVRDGMVPVRGVIHITPPNANLVLEEGRLRLRATGQGPKPSVDTFFRSLAADAGQRAVGIVLSGTGSDGALGIQAIRAAGGITLAQKAESAKYDSMPKAASHTGAVDSVLAPEEIARELVRISACRPGKRPRRAGQAKADPYENIMRILERQVGVDFFKYKQATIRRRLERRLIATGCTTLEEYARCLERTAGEAQNLLQNILISVTSFFRDAEAFKALAQHTQERVRAKRDGQHFRVWVAGCATGEEPFSLAILLSEAIERAKTNIRLQIFATDLDEQALAFARRATYPASALVGVPSKLIDKYFQRMDDGAYQVRSSLRDTIVFAKHNATEDPPFLGLDLISCRNVLIYFNLKLQEKLFKTFEYALAKGGLLFLGKSEAIPHGSNAFRLVGRRQKIFERLATRGEVPQHQSRRAAVRETAFITRAKETGQALDLFNSVVSGLAPDSVIIDGQLYVKHIFGAAGELLMHPAGQATQNISKLLPPDMGAEMLALVHKAEKTGHAASGRRHDHRGKIVQTTVVPLAVGGSGNKDFLACFHSVEAGDKGEKARKRRETLPAEERATQLQDELNEVREHLQTVLEEQETANEEMQSLNEELQSSNEELQSSNEELETTNEELQSSNEELTTVNEELTVKTAEMQSMNQRLQAIQNAIVYPLLIVDRQKRLLNFNPAARQLFRLVDGDLGMDMREAGTLNQSPLVPLLENAISRRKEPSLQLELGERSFEVRIQLFRNMKGLVEGAVASFVENTQVLRALADSRQSRERLSSILEATPAVVTMKDLGGVYVYANKRFSDTLGVRPEAIIGHTDEELFGKEVGAKLREHDLEVVKRKKAGEVTERYGLGGAGSVWSAAKFPLFDAKKRVQSICTISLDMTERITYGEHLEQLKRAFSASNQGVLILEGDEKDFRVSFASEPLAALANTSAGKLNGLTLAQAMGELKLPARAPNGGADIAAVMREQTDNLFLLPMTQPAGDPRWLEVRSSKVEPGKGSRVVLTFVDVTERIRDQRIIEQQQDELARITRFSALGEIAAGIAHEVNTPLNVIVAQADILTAMANLKPVEVGEAHRIASDITRMAKNVSEIVHSLASAAAHKSNRLEKADLKRLIADAVRMCEPRANRINAEVRLVLPEGEVAVECYPVQIMQVVINLVNNAIDAVAERRQRWVQVALHASANDVELIITDSGPGIASAMAEKVFMPFFTTKKDGGTGIGLSLSRSIARRHHGELTLDAHADNTAFRITLPRKQPDRRIVVLDPRTADVDAAIAVVKDKAPAARRGPERAA